MSARTKQGGRVDEAMVQRALVAYYSGDNDAVQTFRPEMRRALEAALAQNAQGEAVAWMAIHPGIGDVVLFTEFPQNYADAGVQVTPLYTHAEPARVPQEWRSLLANLASVVRVQNGNRHDDTNRLLDHADRLLAVTPQPDTTGATP